MNLTIQRFVSLAGFFAIHYPKAWKQEMDEAGHYIFYDAIAGGGVLRIITSPNTAAIESEKLFMEKLTSVHKAFGGREESLGPHTFVSYTQVHEIEGKEFSIYYWVTLHNKQTLIFSYTVLTNMKDMPAATLEKQVIREMLESLEFPDEQSLPTH